MKTKSVEESEKPAFAIRVHLTDGSVESFAQTDADVCPARFIS